MIVITLAQNRAEIAKIKKADLDKHFYLNKGQCYKVYPDGLTRMRITMDGQEQESEEVIVYWENALVPHVQRNVDYSAERIVTEIQTHKLMTPTGLMGKTNLWMHKVEEWRTALGPYMVWIIVGLVLAYAFLA